MKKRYIAIYNGEEGTKSIFFDNLAKKLVVVEINSGKGKTSIISGFLGILVYYLFGNMLFKLSIDSLVLVLLIVFSGMIGGFLFNIVINRIANSDNNKLEYILNIDDEELEKYMNEGKKQLRKYIWMLFFLIVMLCVCLVPLYSNYYSVLLLFSALFFSTIVFLFIGVVSPLKRMSAYRYIKKNKELLFFNIKGEIHS
ncbi:hypothetical protein [Enterococcus rivorum]|uniref:Tandem five-TM protein n=1 Tax=Enterococcus rivorum TaxID=762845 RepID=A0A1E5KUF5_9ENTE|nr:hypothetical protein [Enterococcus rivorum]MBP2099839.1 magnesium-transporting ATPase (P-type) [Enterococcus rivorum]OEH81506.1 hypothetical protein BCR26_04495 [Enterococcus rivorum]